MVVPCSQVRLQQCTVCSGATMNAEMLEFSPDKMVVKPQTVICPNLLTQLRVP